MMKTLMFWIIAMTTWMNCFAQEDGRIYVEVLHNGNPLKRAKVEMWITGTDINHFGQETTDSGKVIFIFDKNDENIGATAKFFVTKEGFRRATADLEIRQDNAGNRITIQIDKLSKESKLIDSSDSLVSAEHVSTIPIIGHFLNQSKRRGFYAGAVAGFSLSAIYANSRVSHFEDLKETTVSNPSTTNYDNEIRGWRTVRTASYSLLAASVLVSYLDLTIYKKNLGKQSDSYNEAYFRKESFIKLDLAPIPRLTYTF